MMASNPLPPTLPFPFGKGATSEVTMQRQHASQRSRFAVLLPVGGAALILGHALWVFAQGPPVEKGPPIEKGPEPDKKAQAKAETLLRKVFQDDYQKAKSDPAAAATLADHLIKEAKQTNDDPALRFVALREARDLAASAGNVNLGLK